MDNTEKALQILKAAEIKESDFKSESIYNTIIGNIIMLLIEQDLMKKTIEDLRSENDIMQEHLMHNEAELIPLRKENKDLHFKNDLLEDICLTHQNLTQWIEEQIDEIEPRVFKVEDDFIETLFDEIININHKPYTQAGRV